MNLGVDAKVAASKGRILHEFGHALGLIHTHQNPKAKIPWDIKAVVNFYNGQFGWDLEEINYNVLQVHDENELQNLDENIDKDSIMMYPIEQFLLKPGKQHFATVSNSELSKNDIDSIRKIYNVT